MAYDIDKLLKLERKRDQLAEAFREGWKTALSTYSVHEACADDLEDALDKWLEDNDM